MHHSVKFKDPTLFRKKRERRMGHPATDSAQGRLFENRESWGSRCDELLEQESSMIRRTGFGVGPSLSNQNLG